VWEKSYIFSMYFPYVFARALPLNTQILERNKYIK
jgi:hypothetical protein